MKRPPQDAIPPARPDPVLEWCRSNGYDSIEAWARDSGYEQVWLWLDEDGNQVSIHHAAETAMEASTEFGLRQPHYIIRTPEGYVGRYTMTEELQGDMSRGMAYTFDTREDAERVAATVPAECTIEEIQ